MLLLTRALAPALFLLASAGVSAQSPDPVYDVLVDLDRNAATGCTVTPTGNAPISGYERRLRAVLDPDTLTVTSVELQACDGTGFQPQMPLQSGYPAALNTGVGGADAIEFAVTLDALGARSQPLIRLAFAADNFAGSDVLTTTTGAPGGPVIVLGLPISVPTLSILGLVLLALIIVVVAWRTNRRARQWGAVGMVMLVATVAWAANFMADGDLTDWAGLSPSASDPTGDATNGSSQVDLVAGFAAIEGDGLYFRIDVVDIENQAPVSVDDSYSVDEDSALNEAAPGVLANDSDGDGDPITAVLQSGPASAQAFALNADGSFDYTPNANFNGSDSFTYQANDGQVDSAVATVTITVNPINDAPVAVDDAFSTDEDTVLSIPAPGVLVNDSDVEDNPITAVIQSAPTNGTLVLNTDGSFDFTPDADFSGSDSFTYVANDGTDDSTPATVTITITAVNDPPVANDDAYTGTEDTVLNIGIPGVLTNDTDIEGGALTAAFQAGPANGSVILNADGSFTYTPDADFYGVDSFTYVANDSAADSNIATVTITVEPVNDAPIAGTPLNYTVTTNIQIDVPAASGLLMGASDEPREAGDPTGPAMPGTNLTVGNGANPPPTSTANGGSLVIDPDGGFRYDPPAGFSGNDTFTYVVCDNGIGTPGPLCSPPATATLAVAGPTVWFIDNNLSGGGNDGRLNSPFESLAAYNASTAPGTGDFIFLATGNAYSGNLVLDSAQTVVGQGATGTLLGAGSRTGIIPAPFSVANPYNLTGTPADWPRINSPAGNAVAVVDNNNVIGIRIGDTPAGTGLVDAAPIGTLTVRETEIIGTGAVMVLDDGGAALDADFARLSTSTAITGIVVDGVGGSLTSDVTSLTGVSLDGIRLASGSLNADFGNSTIDADLDAIRIANVSGTVALNNIGGLSGGQDAIESSELFGTLRITGPAGLTADTGACASIVSTLTTDLDISVESCTTGLSVTNGILLDTVAGTGFTVRNATSIGMPFSTVAPNASSNEAIRLVNTTVPIDISSGSTVTIAGRRETGIYGLGIGSTLQFGSLIDANGLGAAGNSVHIESASGSVTFDSVQISNTVQSQARILGLSGGINYPFPTNTIVNRSDGHGMLLIDVAGGMTISNASTIFNLGPGVIADSATPTNQGDPSRFSSTSGIDARNTQVSAPGGLIISPNAPNSGAALTFRNPPPGSTHAFPNLQITGVQGNANAIEILSETNHTGASFSFPDLQTSGFGGASVQASDVFRVGAYPGASGTLTLDIVGSNSPATTGANCFMQSHGLHTLLTNTFVGTLDLRIENCRIENLSTFNSTGGIGSITVLTSNAGGGSFTADILDNYIDMAGPGGTGGEPAINLVLNADSGTENGLATVRGNTLLNSTGMAYRNDPIGGNANLSRAEFDNNTIRVVNNVSNGLSINHNVTASDASFRVTNNDIQLLPPANAFNAHALFLSSNAAGTSPARYLVENNTLINDADFSLGSLGAQTGTGTTAVMEATVRNNNPVDAAGSFPLGDLEIFIDSTGTQCFDFENNVFPTPLFSLFNSSGTTANLRDVGNTPAILPQPGFTASASGCPLPAPVPFS